ncbi:MAG: hypothetical protein WA988_06930 [Candidatus Nanopelagicales bacterium]
MIFNRSVMCPGCDQAVQLRISVAHKPNQRCYFVCPHCSSTKPGESATDQDAGELGGLLIDGRPAIYAARNGARPQVVNVFTDLPVDSKACSLLDPGESPFITHLQRLGKDDFGEWAARMGTFDSLVKSSWRDIVRWWGFYERWDWTRFRRARR